ncbi:uncharacterized protein LOC143027679 [Oratosquilla oratoria]|uniref:uncharacterized protein LOC143027679 n=1 Tax=Oratosquilla oratoria TaxID=337810 RepID=UPI003F76D1E2
MKLRVTPRSSWTSRGLDLVGVFVVILSVEGVVTLLPREQERTSGLQSPSESTRINTTGGRPSGLSNNGSPFHPSAGVETSFSAFGDIDSGRCSFIDNVYVNSGRQYIVFQAMKYDGMNFEDIIRKGHDTMCQDMWEFSLMGVETRKELDNFIYCMLCSFFGFAAQNKTHIITGGIVSVPNGGCSLTEWYKYGSWLDWGTPTTNGIADEVVLLDSTTGEEVPGSNHVHAGKYGVLLLGSMGQKCSSEGNTYRRWGLLKLDATGEALRSIGHGMCETIDSSVSPTTSKTTPTTVPSTTSTTTIASTTSTTTPSTTTTTTTETTTTETTTPTTESTTLSSSTLSSTSSTLATTTPFTVPPDCCLSPSHDGGKITEQDVLCPGLLQETSCPEGFAGVVVIACEGGPPPRVSVVNDTCVHLWVNEVESLIEEGTTPANDIANDVLLHTDAGSSITPDDLERLPTVLHNLTLLEEQQVEAEVDGSSKVALVKDYTETVVKIVDSVLLNTDLWDQVNEELAVFVGPELLKEMEFTSFLLAEVMPFSPAMNYTMKGLTLDVVVYSAPKTDVPDVPLFFPGPRATSYIQLPPGFKNLLGKDPAKKDQREREAGKEKDKEEEGEKEEVGEGEVEGGKEEEKDVEKEEEEEEDGNRGRTFGIRKHEAKWMSDTEYTRDVDENKMYIDNELTKDRVKIDQEKRRGLDQEKKLRTGQAKITPKKRNKLFRNKNKRETEAMNSAAFAKEAKQARQSKGASAKEVKKSKRDEEAFVAQTLTGEGDRAYVSNDPQQNDEQLNNNIENFNNVAVDDERGKDAMLTKQNEEEEHFGTSRSEDKGAENDPKPKGDVKDPLRLVTYILKGPTARRIMPGSANTLQQGGGRTVNSDVISMTIGAPGMRLEFPRGADGAMIELRHRLHEKGPPYRDIYREPSASSAESAVVGSSRCVFWDYDLRKWNPSGCVVKRRGRDDTRCECRHLTTFAVLTDTHHYLGRDKTLDILGTTLSAISCVSLFLAFVALSCTR